MKHLVLLILLFSIINLSAQNKYDFDYLLEFDDKTPLLKNSTHTDSTSFYLVNSNQNGYILYVSDKDSLNHHLIFNDREKTKLSFKINKESFANTKIIRICQQNFTPKKKKDINENDTKKYYFKNFNDTIINNEVFYHYALKNNIQKQIQKRKEIITCHFIVKKDILYFIPFLYHSLAYQKWKEDKNTPNGFPYMIYYENFNGDITFKMTLKNSIKIDKSIVISTECK
ncbi:hypothetical protein [Flavobacterium sp. J27]|uniref:hypothetical protein n=1 Tax=Flavobacterium sp. J27 TaxID=2060419 RepID=UPI001032724B|nr:hypothetical protein [Flavobacterium sp. J27]